MMNVNANIVAATDTACLQISLKRLLSLLLPILAIRGRSSATPEMAGLASKRTGPGFGCTFSAAKTPLGACRCPKPNGTFLAGPGDCSRRPPAHAQITGLRAISIVAWLCLARTSVNGLAAGDATGHGASLWRTGAADAAIPRAIILVATLKRTVNARLVMDLPTAFALATFSRRSHMLDYTTNTRNWPSSAPSPPWPTWGCSRKDE